MNNTIKSIALAIFLSPVAALSQSAPSPTPPPRQPTVYEQVISYQRDQATKALQDAQVELAVKSQQVQELSTRVAALEKEVADLKAKVPAIGPSAVNSVKSEKPSTP